MLKSSLVKSATTISIAILGFSAQTATAKDFRVQISAHVPIACEFSVQNSFTELSANRYRVAKIDQFCNTGYEMAISHAPLTNQAQVRFRDTNAQLGSNFTVLQTAGRPVNSAADLFLETSNQQDATLFASTMMVSVTPIGL